MKTCRLQTQSFDQVSRMKSRKDSESLRDRSTVVHLPVTSKQATDKIKQGIHLLVFSMLTGDEKSSL